MLKDLLKKEKRTLSYLSLFLLMALLIRWFAISNNSIIFWFDQSRDAYISRQIIENHDLKILGPSASGTNDTLYHGVLYYYFLAPLYSFSGGNPLVPTFILSMLGTFGVFPLYYFVKSLFPSKKTAPWLSVLGFVVSAETIHLSHWLSNPSLAVMPLIVFYWSLWEVGFKNNKKFVFWLAISFGIAVQSALWLVYLLGPILVAILYNYEIFNRKSILLDWKNIFKFFVYIFIIISTIVIGQLILWKNHVFSQKSLGLTDAIISLTIILELVQTYVQKLIQSLGAATPIASLVLLGFLFNHMAKFNTKLKVFFISWFFAPVWLFLLEPRGSIHILMSLEIALLILLSSFINDLWSKKSVVFMSLSVILGALYLVSNLLILTAYKTTAASIFSPQQGTNLADQLALIDYTYETANFEPFSFSAFTNPNGYYITWAYLYDWYGQKKYGYKPTFVGPDQKGLFGADLLPRDDVSRNHYHFTIIELNLMIVPKVIRDEFAAEQDRLAPVTQEQTFGSTNIELRKVEENNEL